MTDVLERDRLRFRELRGKGPVSVQDAETVGVAFCKAAEAAMLAGEGEDLYVALDELRVWLYHLPARRRILNEEAKRLEREPPVACYMVTLGKPVEPSQYTLEKFGLVRVKP